MKGKKLLLFVTISCVFFPTSVFGEEQKETNIGIGFRDEQPAPNPAPGDPSPYEPEPVNNVLPMTLGQTKYQTQPDQPQTASRGTLPKTGEQRQAIYLQFLGLSCVASCFWLFLFTRLREEEEHV